MIANKEDNPIILNTSDEAATFRTNISGWVSRRGLFTGDNKQSERLARLDGCTHILCECGKPAEKLRVKCEECWKAERDKRFASLEKKPWDGKTPLCIWDDDRYFWCEDDLFDYCFDLGLKPSDIKLVICEPVYVSEIEPNDHYSNDLPDEGEVEDGLL